MKKLLALVLAVLMLSAMALSVGAIASNLPGYIPGYTNIPTNRRASYNPSLVLNTFWRKYQIKDVVIEVEGNGTITLNTADAGVATTGDVIGFTVTVADGWKLADLKVVDALGRNVKIAAGKNAGEYSFVMPAVKATIVGTFEECTPVELGQSGLTVLADGFELDMESAFEDENDAYLIAYYLNAETGMDFDVYEWAKEEGVTLEDAALEESDEFTVVEINGYNVAVYTSVDEFDGVEYNTVTYIIDAGDLFEEVVFYLDALDSVSVSDAMIASLTAYDEADETLTQLGESGVAVVLPEGFALDMESAFEDENDAYLVAYYFNAATNMDFDVYEWAKEEGVTLEDAVLEESEEYTVVEINGYDVAVYTSVDEFDGVEYNTVTYIIDAGEYFEEIVFFLDGEGAAAVAEAMMATLA